MQADGSVGLDDDQGLFPTGPDSWKKGPEGSLYWTKPKLASHLGVGGELLAQSELAQDLLVLASEEGWNTAKEGRRELEHVT